MFGSLGPTQGSAVVLDHVTPSLVIAQNRVARHAVWRYVGAPIFLEGGLKIVT